MPRPRAGETPVSVGGEHSTAAPADHVASEISGTIELVGGPWPDRHLVPKRAKILIANAKRGVVKSETVTSGSFRFEVPAGVYEVSVHADSIKCGRSQHISVPSSRSLSLLFVCPIR